MAFVDFPVEELLKYKPEIQEEKDFDKFWSDTLTKTRSYPLNAEYKEIKKLFETVRVYDVTFAGYNGQSIKGWYIRPNTDKKVPAVLEYIGYGGGRGLPHDWLLFASAGYGHFIMDTRGQGSAWSPGDTPDVEDIQGNPQYPGFMTKGIEDRESYYYKRVFCDAVRAYEALSSREDVISDKIAVLGSSQGGGITLAAAGLVPEIKYILPDVPFLTHYSRAVRNFDSYPYKEIRDYLNVHRESIDSVFTTLSYFDGVNFSKRAKAKAFFSTALMDDVCPPSTVYAAYNHYTAEKEIIYWEFNGHESGATYQKRKWLETLKEIF